MQLSKEQIKIIESKGNIKINAVAGSGKTTTVIEYAKSRPKDSRILYIAFNKSVKLEANKRFTEAKLNNVQIETAHSLAYKHVVIPFQYKVKLQGYKIHELSEIIGLNGLAEKHAEFILSNHINKFVSIFCNSDRLKVQEINYLDYVLDDKARQFVENYYKIIEQQTRLFLAKMDKGEIDITHDFYLKKFQLMNTQLGYDYILFDEGQDASPAMLDIFMKQNSIKVIVGDTHQQIYGWRNAVNSLEKVDYPNYSLNTSYRFNNNIARLATSVLDWKAYLGPFKSLDILGNGINQKLKQRAIIARSNLGLLLKAIEFITENPKVRKIYFEGNINSYTYADEGASLYDVLNLSTGKRHLIKDALISNMKSIEELEEYIENTEDRQLSMMLEIVNEYGNEIYDLLQNIKSKHVENAEKEQAEMIFSTVHRSKGMEYDEVLLVDDFITEESIDKQINNLDREYNSAKIQEDINLLYVAVTRTKNILHIPEGLLPKGFPQLESINVIKKPEKTSIEKQITVKKKTYNNFVELETGSNYQKSKPKESYQTWTPALDAELIKLFKKGRSIQELAHIFGRSKGSIWARVKKLDLGDYYSE